MLSRGRSMVRAVRSQDTGRWTGCDGNGAVTVRYGGSDGGRRCDGQVSYGDRWSVWWTGGDEQRTGQRQIRRLDQIR